MLRHTQKLQFVSQGPQSSDMLHNNFINEINIMKQTSKANGYKTDHRQFSWLGKNYTPAIQKTFLIYNENKRYSYIHILETYAKR